MCLDSFLESCHDFILVLDKKLNIDYANLGFMEYFSQGYFLLERIYKSDVQAIKILADLIENMPCNIYWMDKDCGMLGANKKVLNIMKMNIEQYIKVQKR